MKEIDTDTSVVWPSWCYSDNIPRNILKECSEIEKDLCVIASEIDIISNYPSLTNRYSNRETTKSQTNISATQHTNLSSVATAEVAASKKVKPPLLSPTASLSQSRQEIGIGKKMLSERSLLLSGYNNTIDSVKQNCDQSNTATPPPPQQLAAPNQGGVLTITPTSTAAAAAAYLYLEKVKNERMSPRVTAAQIDSLKDAIMESSAAAAVAAAMVNNNNNSSINNNNNNNGSSSCGGGVSNCNSISNNLVISQVQNQISNSVINNTSDELQSHSLTQSSSQQQQQHQQQQQQQSLHMNSNHVKKERLSPGTNGDQQSILSRSRSTTPSSFRGASPQQSMRSSPSETLVPMHNLSTNILNTIHQAATSASRQSNINVPSSGITSATSGLPTDFSTRNYSDFMRSLAAKYNNTNPNDSGNLRRNILFETTSNTGSVTVSKKTPTTAHKISYSTSPSTSINKEVPITTTSSLPPPPPLTSAAISPGDPALKMTQQNKMAAAVANAAAACGSNVSPYMTSLLSSLPFSPGIFPPLIDMSSTQALITLARAAKESEIHNILSPHQHPKRSTTSASPSPSPSLNIALQQAAQFVSPALLYSAQLQKQQQQQVSRQSSPRLTNISNSSSNPMTSKKPRNLGEKTNASPLDLSSQQPASKRFKAESTSSQSSTDGLINTTTFTRRASSSTATTSPSPPPINEKSTIVVVGSSTKTEATTTAFMPIKVASSTSTKSSNAPAVNVRQCQAQSEEVNSWTVDDVCSFVGSIDICAEYVKNFRDQCIDGSGLPLLTEDHLINSLGMKLGPALKLRSMLAKKLGAPCPCVTCVAQVQQVLALQTSGITAVAVPAALTNTATASDHFCGGSIKNDKTTIGSRNSSCNSHLPKDIFSINSSMNCSSSNNNNINSSNNNSSNTYVNKNESTTITTTSKTNAIATNSNATNFCNSEDNTDARSNCNINIGNFSTTPQSHNNCNSSNNNNNNATNNRHDNADSSS